MKYHYVALISEFLSTKIKILYGQLEFFFDIFMVPIFLDLISTTRKQIFWKLAEKWPLTIKRYDF